MTDETNIKRIAGNIADSIPGLTEYWQTELKKALLEFAEEIKRGECLAAPATPDDGWLKAGDLWLKIGDKPLNHYNAENWATSQGGALPTRAQADSLTTLKDDPAFASLFNRGTSFPAGYVWLAEPYTNFRLSAWCQRLSDGGQYYHPRNVELPVLCVRG